MNFIPATIALSTVSPTSSDVLKSLPKICSDVIFSLVTACAFNCCVSTVSANIRLPLTIPRLNSLPPRASSFSPSPSIEESENSQDCTIVSTSFIVSVFSVNTRVIVVPASNVITGIANPEL